MNPIDEQIERLLRAAGGMQMAAAPSTPPYGLEARVLAAWREGRVSSFWSTPLLLRGLVLATVITGLCLWPALTQSQAQKSTPDADYLQLADSTLQIDNL